MVPELSVPRRIYRRWMRLIARALRASFRDDISTAAAGVTFYALLAFFPVVGAFVSLYGLFADIKTAREHLAYLGGFLPDGVLTFVGDEMVRAATTHPSKLGIAFAVGLLLSITSANAGVQALISGINVAYEQKETRSFIRYNLRSLAITLVSLGIFLVAFMLLIVLPAVPWQFGPNLLRWPLLWAGLTAALMAIYRYGPNRGKQHGRRVMPGSFVAASLWLLASLIFTWYVSNFAQYDRTYGSLGAMVGFMMWIWIGQWVVLFGAELNAEVEQKCSR